MDYLVICEHCGTRVLTAATIGDPESVTMQSHLRGCNGLGYPQIRRALQQRGSMFGDILRHFRVVSADHGPT